MDIVQNDAGETDRLVNTGLAIQDQELVFQQLINTRMALQPCMDLINTFPLVDAQEFVDLGGEETKINGLDELEAMLTE